MENKEAKKRKAPSAKTIHDAIFDEGMEELKRSSSALFWSGLAAGLSLGFSMVTEGLLNYTLPEAGWRDLYSSFGYSIGFLIVILGKQQLFTENTLMPILPLLQEKTVKMLLNVARLWGIVLTANLAGALIFAVAVTFTPVFEEGVKSEFVIIARKAMEPGFTAIFFRGIFAGWLIALIVWLLPYAETARIWVIVLITYVIGLGHFSHVIAGSVEVFTISVMGLSSWYDALVGFTLPALLGNIAGGVILVAALNHAQTVTERK